MKKHVLITGAGLGGLATALRLSSDGYSVEILEKNNQAGGRLNRLQKDGFTFDMGPTFFSMSYEFKEFIEYCKMEMPFKFIELDPLYTVNYSGSKRKFTIYKDLDKLAAEFSDLEPDFKEKITGYLKKAGSVFHDTEYSMVKRNFTSWLDFSSVLKDVPLKHTPMVFRSMWSELSRHFDSYEAKTIFSLVAFFLGDTPFATPAVYSLLNYTELKHDGYYNVEGGMYKIVEGLLQEIEKRNIPIHYNTEITGYQQEKGRLSALTDQNGKSWTADLFVINSDAAWFRGKIFNRPGFSNQKLDKRKWTIAPFTMYLGLDSKVPGIEHHNYYLGRNFKDYAGKILNEFNVREKPYYYVNVPSKHNASTAPEGCEAMFILCPVPDLRYRPDWSDKQELADNIIADLSDRIEFDLKAHLISETILDPTDWEKMFNLYRGSGLGLAHNLTQIGYFRPKNKDEKFNNVYYVGASTVPGTGLPMMMVGSRLVAERINNEQGVI
ncbi:MAG: phytoene desaturase family protein [Bacteroidales bacterium]